MNRNKGPVVVVLLAWFHLCELMKCRRFSQQMISIFMQECFIVSANQHNCRESPLYLNFISLAYWVSRAVIIRLRY